MTSAADAIAERKKAADRVAIETLQKTILYDAVDLCDEDGDRRILKTGMLRKFEKKGLIKVKFSRKMVVLCNDCIIWANKKGLVQEVIRLERFTLVGNALGLKGAKFGFTVQSESGDKLIFDADTETDKVSWINTLGEAVLIAREVCESSSPVDFDYFARMIKKEAPKKKFPIKGRLAPQKVFTPAVRATVIQDARISPEELGLDPAFELETDDLASVSSAGSAYPKFNALFKSPPPVDRLSVGKKAPVISRAGAPDGPAFSSRFAPVAPAAATPGFPPAVSKGFYASSPTTPSAAAAAPVPFKSPKSPTSDPMASYVSIASTIASIPEGYDSPTTAAAGYHESAYYAGAISASGYYEYDHAEVSAAAEVPPPSTEAYEGTYVPTSYVYSDGGFTVEGAGPEWVARIDPSSGYWYYENTVEGYWQWEPPVVYH